MPLVQGMAWTLIVAGWRFFNRSSQFSGRTIGSKIRRWWWGVNNWRIEEDSRTLRDPKIADSVGEYVIAQSSTAGGD